MVCTFVLIAQLLNYWCNPESLEVLEPPIIQFQLGISAVIGALLIVYGVFWLPNIAPRQDGEDFVPLASSGGNGGDCDYEMGGMEGSKPLSLFNTWFCNSQKIRPYMFQYFKSVTSLIGALRNRRQKRYNKKNEKNTAYLLC